MESVIVHRLASICNTHGMNPPCKTTRSYLLSVYHYLYMDFYCTSLLPLLHRGSFFHHWMGRDWNRSCTVSFSRHCMSLNIVPNVPMTTSSHQLQAIRPYKITFYFGCNLFHRFIRIAGVVMRYVGSRIKEVGTWIRRMGSDITAAGCRITGLLRRVFEGSEIGKTIFGGIKNKNLGTKMGTAKKKRPWHTVS